ncbi:flagellin, partial [Candidatus Dependentiae bacterium]|nr:flagellin [Candidatus Dependentiae bacterium]
MLNGLNGVNQSFTNRMFELNQNNLMKSMQKMSSGLQINNAGDNAAGLAVLARMVSQISGEQQAVYNVQDAYSVMQVAEGGFEAVSSIQGRLRELAVQSSNGTLTDDDRELLQAEADQLVEELDRLSDSVEFNGQKLLNGSFELGTGDFETQAGANSGENISMNLANIDASSLGLNNFDISSQSAAQQSIQKADDSIEKVSEYRSEIGAYQNRLEETYNFLGVQNENQISSASIIGDTDFAEEILNKTKKSLLSNINLAMLA